MPLLNHHSHPDNAAAPHTAASEAIAACSRDFEAAYGRGNARALVAGYFLDDAFEPMASPPGGQAPVRGHAALTAMFEGMFSAVRSIRLQTEQLQIDAALAFELGRAFLTTTEGATVVGRHTVCWQYAGGRWGARVDFFAEDGWLP